MKLKIYCYENKLGAFFGKPFYDVLSGNDFLDQYKQVLFGADEETLKSLLEDNLYCLGEFDNITGEILPQKDFICSLGEVASEVLAKKFGVKEDGNKENA